MFEIGKRYEFQMSDPLFPGGITYQRCEVIEYQAPLLKLVNEEGKEWVLNASSPIFIRAEELTSESTEELAKLMASLESLKAGP